MSTTSNKGARLWKTSSFQWYIGLCVQYTVQLTGNLILARPTLGEYTRAPDRVLSNARYSTHERTGKHLLALRSNTARRVVCYADQAKTQLFLIRALQGYRRTPYKRRLTLWAYYLVSTRLYLMYSMLDLTGYHL